MRRYTDVDYKRVEAMYRRNCSNDYIVHSMPHLCKFEVLDIIQKIFALDEIRKGREYKQRMRA